MEEKSVQCKFMPRFCITAITIMIIIFLAELPLALAGVDGSNISPETAYELTLGQTEYLSIDYYNDEDWYKVSVDHTCTIFNNVTNNSGEIDYILYNSNLIELTSSRLGVGTYTPTWKVPAGTYYIKIRENLYNRRVDYSLSSISLQFLIREEDAFENNDNFSNAYELTTGVTLSGIAIEATNDNDWFKITVEEECSIISHLTNNSGELYFALYNSSLTQLTRFHCLNSANIAWKVPAGTYYIRIWEYEYYRGVDHFQSNISLCVNLRSIDLYENNDTAAQATEIIPGQSLSQIAIEASNDVDWFKVTTDHSCTMQVSITNNSGMLYYSIYDQNLNQICKYWMTASSSKTIAASPGSYYIKIEEYSYNRYIDYWNSDISLTISLVENNCLFLATLGNPYNSIKSNDPVNPINGNFTYEYHDVSIPTRSLPLHFTRYYNSRSSESGPIGKGWTHNYQSCLTFKDTDIQVLYADGHSTLFTFDSGLYQAQPGCFETLVDNGDGTYTLTFTDQTRHVYDANGKMTQIVDRNNNITTLQYNSDLLATVTEPAGRSLQFSYDQDNRIIQIDDPAQRAVQFTYDSSGNLATVEGFNGGTTIYSYGECGLESITDPEGNIVVENIYDAISRVIEQKDGCGNSTYFTYDIVNRNNVMTDAKGYGVTFLYDENFHITQMNYPENFSESRGYDTDGNIVSETDRNGNTSTYTYDGCGNRLTRTAPSPLDYVTTASYDNMNNPTQITDTAGYITDLTYDDNGNLLTISREVGENTATVSYTYNAYGQVTSITNTNGKITSLVHDQYGNLESSTDPLGNTVTYTYDIVGRRLTETTPRGNEAGADPQEYTYTYEYDAAGNLLSITDPLGNKTVYTYNLNNYSTTITDPGLNTTTTAYDGNGNIILITDALNNDIVYSYDANGNLSSFCDRNGNTTAYEYDFLDRLLKITYPNGSSETLTLDGNGNMLTLTDRNGNTSIYEYDVLNRLTKTTDAMSNESSFTYDELGNITSATDPRGKTTSYTYDENSHLLTVTDPLDNITAYTYDLAGNQVSLTNALNNTWTYEYDDVSQLIGITTSLGYSIARVYDADGNIISQTDANGNIISYEYDPLQRLISVTNALDNQSSYSYDAGGNLIEVEDALGNRSSFAYDGLNRLIEKTNPLNKTVAYSYDDEGNLIRLDKADGSIIEYNYDSNNRLVKIEYPDQTKINFTYDNNGNRTSMADAQGTTTYNYDNLNRLTEVNRNGKAISYEYDRNSNITAIEYPDSTKIYYSYTDLNQIQTVSDAVYSSQFIYNGIGNRIREILSNGVEVNYSYDNDNRLAALEHVYGQDTLASFTYSLDNMGNPLGVTDKNGAITEYIYDALYQLVEIEYPNQEIVAYTYDAVGNRTSANNIDYTYNSANQLINVDDITYSYDDNGCLTLAGSKQLSYDYEDRLVEIDDGINIINFIYDGDGNRIGQTVAGAVYASSEFTWDINFPLPRLIMEENNNDSYNYIYGGRLLSRNGPEGLVFYHQDGLGSTSALSSLYGEILLEYDYDAFGNLRNTYGRGYNPMQFTGEYFDDPAGLIYLRARYYDPNIGRFITPDSYNGTLNNPLSRNLYAYCGNNPVAYVDPSGHIRICQWDDLFRGIGAGSIESIQDLLYSPKAIYYLVIGLLSGKISGEEYLEAMSQILAPIRNIIANTAYIFSSDQTSDQEVYQYGKDAGTVFTDIGLTVAGGTGLAKVTSKLSKAARATKGIQGTRKTVPQVADSQVGKKLVDHAADYGLTKSKEGAVAYKQITQDVLQNAQTVKTGNWKTLGECEFWIKGNDVAIVKDGNWVSTFPLNKPGTVEYINSLPIKK